MPPGQLPVPCAAPAATLHEAHARLLPHGLGVPLHPSDKGRQRRERLEWPDSVDPAADHWQGGTAWQITGLEQVPVQGLGGGASGAPAAGSKAGGSQVE